MTRSKKYWLKFLVANWYATALITFLLFMTLWAMILGLLGQTNTNWPAIASIWAVVAGIALWAVYRTKRARVRELAQLNATLPDQITLTNEGVASDGPNGATVSLPWRNFNGWREGQRVMLIDLREGNRFVMLPVAQLSEIDRQPIRLILRLQFSPVSE